MDLMYSDIRHVVDSRIPHNLGTLRKKCTSGVLGYHCATKYFRKEVSHHV